MLKKVMGVATNFIAGPGWFHLEKEPGNPSLFFQVGAQPSTPPLEPLAAHVFADNRLGLRELGRLRRDHRYTLLESETESELPQGHGSLQSLGMREDELGLAGRPLETELNRRGHSAWRLDASTVRIRQ